jgi:putative ABC transport system permease protein
MSGQIALAWPAAYFISKRWLQGFAYRIELDWEIFALSALTALAIAGLTVNHQAAKSAVANPVESLRYE